MNLNNNLFGLSQVSSNNPLLNRQQMNIGAGLNGVNNITGTIARGKQNKQIEQNKKKLDFQQRQLQAQQYNQQINNNFMQANTLPLQQRNKNGF